MRALHVFVHVARPLETTRTVLRTGLLLVTVSCRQAIVCVCSLVVESLRNCMLVCSVYGFILRQPSRPVLTVGLVSPPPYAAVCADDGGPAPEDGRGVPERAPAIHLWALAGGSRYSLGNEPLVWAAAVRSADGNKAAVFVGGGRDGRRRGGACCTAPADSSVQCPLPPQPQQPSLRICGGLAHSHMPRDPHPRNDLTAAGGPAPALAPCRCITNCCGARAPPVPPTTSLLLLAALCSRRCQSSTL